MLFERTHTHTQMDTYTGYWLEMDVSLTQFAIYAAE